MNADAVRFGAAVLGAGASGRMGQPKLLLKWADTSIIGHLLDLWHRVGARQVAVVCAPPPHPLHAELDRINIPPAHRILNLAPSLGMFSSIRCAASWNGWAPDLSHVALVLGDQPQISAAAVSAVLQHSRNHPADICQLTFEGRPKHPILLPRAVLPELAAFRRGPLRDFLNDTAWQRSFIEVLDPTLIVDLDSPEDYRTALARFAPRLPTECGRDE